MSDPKFTYLHDHLAGAKFAVNLLDDLSQQDFDIEVAKSAGRLRPEIESDRMTLETFVNQLGGHSSAIKDAAGWVAQKAGRMKLDINDPLGLFEAVEVLALGVLGKIALWSALDVVHRTHGCIEGLDLKMLLDRAKAQHRELESLRLRLAANAL